MIQYLTHRSGMGGIIPFNIEFSVFVTTYNGATFYKGYVVKLHGAGNLLPDEFNFTIDDEFGAVFKYGKITTSDNGECIVSNVNLNSPYSVNSVFNHVYARGPYSIGYYPNQCLPYYPLEVSTYNLKYKNAFIKIQRTLHKQNGIIHRITINKITFVDLKDTNVVLYLWCTYGTSYSSNIFDYVNDWVIIRPTTNSYTYTTNMSNPMADRNVVIADVIDDFKYQYHITIEYTDGIEEDSCPDYCSLYDSCPDKNTCVDYGCPGDDGSCPRENVCPNENLNTCGCETNCEDDCECDGCHAAIGCDYDTCGCETNCEYYVSCPGDGCDNYCPEDECAQNDYQEEVCDTKGYCLEYDTCEMVWCPEYCEMY